MLPGSRFAATGDCRTKPASGSCVRGAAKAEFRLERSPKGRRRYGKFARIASLARDFILSRAKVYTPAQATGLKQTLFCIAYRLR